MLQYVRLSTRAYGSEARGLSVDRGNDGRSE